MNTIVDPTKLVLREDPNFISPPYLKGSLFQGAQSITVYGHVLGAAIDVEIDDKIVSSIREYLPHPDGVLIHLATKLKQNQNVRVRQKKTEEVKSDWSEISEVIDVRSKYPIVLPRPKVRAPLYECSSRTFISNLISGGNARILSGADKDIIGAFVGCKERQSLDIVPNYYSCNQKITVESEIDGTSSYESVEHTIASVRQLSQSLKQPVINPIYEGQKYVLVEDVINGADVYLFRESLGSTSVLKSGSDKCFIPVGIPFKVGEKIAVWQSICSENFASSSKSIASVNDRSLLPPPEVGPVQVGDNSIQITNNFVYGSSFIVYINQIQAGRGGGPKIPLLKEIECDDLIHIQPIWDIFNDIFKLDKILEIKPLCVNPPIGEDPSELDFYPVGTSILVEETQNSGSPSIEFEAAEPAALIYYPAEEDGRNKPFNKMLAAKGPVPIVFIAHGKHGVTSYEGFTYFQEKLAKMGIMSVSINFMKVNKFNYALNITERASHLVYNIFRVIILNLDPKSRFHQKINFNAIGLLGHSRGGEAVILAANELKNKIFFPDSPDAITTNVRGVISLAPTNFISDEFLPKDYDFMTILPALDGDVYKNDGAIFYDNAKPKNFKCQLFVHNALHNLFNRKLLPDAGIPSDAPVTAISRRSHQNILTSYGIAFFRAVLKRESTLPYLTGHTIPEIIPQVHDKVHISFEFAKSMTVDDHEDNNGINLNSLSLPVNITNLPVEEHLFNMDNSTFSGTFIGHSNGIIILALQNGVYQSKLPTNTNILGKEIWIRVAEVFEDYNLSMDAIDFDLGIEDKDGIRAYINSSEVGGVPRPSTPYFIGAPVRGKTALKTLRFPSLCFKCNNSKIDLTNITSILIRGELELQPGNGILISPSSLQKLAVDDLQIVEVKKGLGPIDDLHVTPVLFTTPRGGE